MGEKDTKAKEYFGDNRRFADLCNFYMYDGEQIIHPGDLSEKDTTEVLSVFGLQKSRIHVEQKMRDLLKSAVIKKTENCFVALIGIEEQSQVHYAMPVKNMLYDALNYGSQVKDKARQHRKEKDYDTGAEFLSGFKLDDELIPVVTITLYLGENEWDGPRSLFDMYGDRLDEKFKSIDNETAQAISIFARMDIKVNEEGETMDMCKAWDEHFLSGEKRGLSEGRSQGRQEEIFASVQEGDYSVERGAEKLELSVEDFTMRMLEEGYRLPMETVS